MSAVTVLTTFLGYFVIVAFFRIESGLRKGEEARSLSAGQYDQRSTRFVGQAWGFSVLALLVSWLFNMLKLGVLPIWVGWAGIVLALFGFFFRWWSNRVLGAFYTRTLKVSDAHIIVQTGPYRLIRHPGYLGSILMWTGAAMATANWIVILVILVAMVMAYHYRMNAEEEMLLKTKKEYAEYCSRTKRLIPLIY